MNPERWERLESIYHSALERPASERDAYLAEACVGDEAMRQEVETLIASHERSDNFINRHVFDLGMRALAENSTVFGAGMAIGHYVLQGVIGRGGMGDVYLAEDPRLGRKVALKLLPNDLKGNPDRVRRFRQEARAASAVSHPNIAHVYDVGESEGLFYMAIEYVDGTTLRQKMTEGRLGLGRVLAVGMQTAEALAAAHAAGVIHRDVKPENVMVRPDGYVKVLDFGLAKLVEHLTGAVLSDQQAATIQIIHSQPGMVMGTVKYMSPEQARGLPVDARTDVWSLGVVLYEMVTGRAPFDGETVSDTLVQILDHELPPVTDLAPALRTKLQAVITKALRKDPADRYQTADELARDLKELRKELEDGIKGDVASRPVLSTAHRGGIKRQRGHTLLWGMLLMVVIAGISYWLYGSMRRTNISGVKKADMAASPGEAKEELNETDIHLRGVELSCFTPEGIEVSWSSVAEVDVTLVGEKRMLDRINVRHLTTAYLDVSELKAGDRVVRLIPGKNVSMDLPSGVRIQGVEPKAVTVRLRKLPTPTP